eukprot:CAMPEP_0180050528 /NCGR_PEP_ID=MMETSP0985-20121206/647_1 /TAXON_ID=483367 /ORGANISM="non described non described, Strain CCMP 2436" /LENGTH=152 /DNA_ID=CAMNT_0021979671 /DNA_START=1022 /DNA_END=1476 /DNA_ORIENTATION=+
MWHFERLRQFSLEHCGSCSVGNSSGLGGCHGVPDITPRHSSKPGQSLARVVRRHDGSKGDRRLRDALRAAAAAWVAAKASVGDAAAGPRARTCETMRRTPAAPTSAKATRAQRHRTAGKRPREDSSQVVPRRGASLLTRRPRSGLAGVNMLT